jgi:hypothetical protein
MVPRESGMPTSEVAEMVELERKKVSIRHAAGPLVEQCLLLHPGAILLLTLA